MYQSISLSPHNPARQSLQPCKVEQSLQPCKVELDNLLFDPLNAPIDPDQRHHWPFSIDPDRCPIDPFQCHHWPFLHPPLTLFNATIDPFSIPHWPWPMPPLTTPPDFFKAPIDPLQCPHWIFWRPHWKYPTPVEIFQRPHWKDRPQIQLDTSQTQLDTPQIRLDTPQIRLDTPQIRLDTPQIRLNTTLNDKSNWIRTNSDWIRPLPPPKALNRRHWGSTSVQAVSWKTYATISTNSKPQPNQNKKNATSPHQNKGKYVEKYMIYYVVA